MSKIDLRQLTTFQVVAKEGSISKAAESLFLSQPALSAQLKALEETLGLKLFERTARGMNLTVAGTELLAEATKALEAAGDLLTRAKTLQAYEAPQEFRLGTISDPSMLKLGELSSELGAQFPQLRLSFIQGISGEVIERVCNSELDAGFVIGEPSDGRIRRLRVAPISLRVVAPTQWKEKTEGVGWEEIVALPWISTPENCSYRQIAARMFRSQGLMPKTIVEADQETVLIDLVMHGVGLALLREDIAARAAAKGKLTIWSPGVANDHIYFIHRPDSAGAPLVEAASAAVHRLWKLNV